MYHITPKYASNVTNNILGKLQMILDIDGIGNLIEKSPAYKNIFIETLVVQTTRDFLMMLH